MDGPPGSGPPLHASEDQDPYRPPNSADAPLDPHSAPSSTNSQPSWRPAMQVSVAPAPRQPLVPVLPPFPRGDGLHSVLTPDTTVSTPATTGPNSTSTSSSRAASGRDHPSPASSRPPHPPSSDASIPVHLTNPHWAEVQPYAGEAVHMPAFPGPPRPPGGPAAAAATVGPVDVDWDGAARPPRHGSANTEPGASLPAHNMRSLEQQLLMCACTEAAVADALRNTVPEFTPGLRGLTMIMSHFAKQGEWQRAMHLFTALQVSVTAIDTQACNAALAACHKGADGVRASRIYADMTARPVPVEPNEVTHRLLVSTLVKSGDWVGATQAFVAMCNGPRLVDSLTCMSLICVLDKRGLWQLAEAALLCYIRRTPLLCAHFSRLFGLESAPTDNLPPEAISLLHGMEHSWRSRIGPTQEEMGLHAQYHKDCTVVGCCNALIRAYTRPQAQQVSRALTLFSSMLDSDIAPPDVVTYNTIIEALGMGSRSPPDDVFAMMHAMNMARVTPTTATFTVLISTLELQAEPELAVPRIRESLQHCGWFVNPEQADLFLEAMVLKGYHSESLRWFTTQLQEYGQMEYQPGRVLPRVRNAPFTPRATETLMTALLECGDPMAAVRVFEQSLNMLGVNAAGVGLAMKAYSARGDWRNAWNALLVGRNAGVLDRAALAIMSDILQLTLSKVEGPEEASCRATVLCMMTEVVELSRTVRDAAGQ